MNFGVDLTYLALNFALILHKFNAFNANLSIPFQTTLRFQKFFKFFFQGVNFFTVSTPILHKVRNMRSEKNSFLVLFYSAKSNSDHFTISNFSSFFSKINFFTVLIPYTAQVRKVQSAKNLSLVLFYRANLFQTILRFQNFFKFFFQKINFFTVSNPILQRWETWGQKQIIFSALW